MIPVHPQSTPTGGQLSIRQCLVLLAALLLIGFSFSTRAELLAGHSLVNALRQGGHHVYFRHEATDWSQEDHVSQAGDWLSCDGNRIRQLSEQGREQATATGKAIRQLGIPVGPVWASPYCRTMETARLLDLGAVVASEAVINMRVAHFFGGRSEIVKTTQKLLSSLLPEGENSIIVAHGNVAREATPAYPGEGEALIFKPDGVAGFRLVGRLTPEQWLQLAAEGQ